MTTFVIVLRNGHKIRLEVKEGGEQQFIDEIRPEAGAGIITVRTIKKLNVFVCSNDISAIHPEHMTVKD